MYRNIIRRPAYQSPFLPMLLPVCLPSLSDIIQLPIFLEKRIIYIPLPLLLLISFIITATIKDTEITRESFIRNLSQSQTYIQINTVQLQLCYILVIIF